MNAADEDVVDWDAIAEEERRAAFRRTNTIRVRGYLMACAKRARLAYEAHVASVDALEAARKKAGEALRHVKNECDHAEEVARLVALGDDDVNDELARRLEEMGW